MFFFNIQFLDVYGRLPQNLKAAKKQTETTTGPAIDPSIKSAPESSRPIESTELNRTPPLRQRTTSLWSKFKQAGKTNTPTPDSSNTAPAEVLKRSRTDSSSNPNKGTFKFRRSSKRQKSDRPPIENYFEEASKTIETTDSKQEKPYEEPQEEYQDETADENDKSMGRNKPSKLKVIFPSIKQ